MGSKAYILPIPDHPLQSSHRTHRPLAFQNKQELSVTSIPFMGMSSVILWDQCFPVLRFANST